MTVVTIPTDRPARKEAPIAKPSVRLCVKSAARFRYPATLMSETEEHRKKRQKCIKNITKYEIGTQQITKM